MVFVVPGQVRAVYLGLAWIRRLHLGDNGILRRCVQLHRLNLLAAFVVADFAAGLACASALAPHNVTPCSVLVKNGRPTLLSTRLRRLRRDFSPFSIPLVQGAAAII